MAALVGTRESNAKNKCSGAVAQGVLQSMLGDGDQSWLSRQSQLYHDTYRNT
jgi:hypothetical protein